MGKQKNIKSNPRKVMQGQINEIGQATGMLISESKAMNNHLVGLEHLVMGLAEFLGKKEGFEKFLKEKIDKLEEEKKAKEQVKKAVTEG